MCVCLFVERTKETIERRRNVKKKVDKGRELMWKPVMPIAMAFVVVVFVCLGVFLCLMNGGERMEREDIEKTHNRNQRASRRRDRLTHAAVKGTNELSLQRQGTGEEAEREGVNRIWTRFRNTVNGNRCR